MPPPPKKAPPPKAPIRPPISASSLVFAPNDALEGFQERLEKCVTWNSFAVSIRNHHRNGIEPDLPIVTFTEAYEKCIWKSFLCTFFDECSNMTFEEQWEQLDMTLFDGRILPTEEAEICFNNNNCLTNKPLDFLKQNLPTLRGDRKELWRRFYDIATLRLLRTGLTTLDDHLAKFSKLTTLNLAGNFLKDFDSAKLPRTLLFLELECNVISTLDGWIRNLPPNLLYLGLSNNLLTNEGLFQLYELPPYTSTLDLSDNDIYSLPLVLEMLSKVKDLRALMLFGNPCAMCNAYPRLTLNTLKKLKWLDCRQVGPTDNLIENIEVHPDDLRSCYFYMNVFRVISVLPPPRCEKGVICTYHIEVELPLLDSLRRNFLFFHQNESLEELLPEPEDNSPSETIKEDNMKSLEMIMADGEESLQESCVYDHLMPKNPRLIRNYTIFQSNNLSWSKIMLFQDPIVRIFCPDMKAIRDMFRSIIRVRLVFNMVSAKETAKKKPTQELPPDTRFDHDVDIFNITCSLKNVDWSQPYQHFHWDESMDTNEAIHWGDGDLSIVQYITAVTKPTKGKSESNAADMARQAVPDILTAHLGFGIEMLNTADPPPKPGK